VFHALSDPTRLRILSLLERNERCVCELTDALGAAQSRLSFHLKILKEAGLLVDRKEGRWVYYRLDPEALEEYGAVLDLLPRMPPKRRSAECCT
jgi:ArsR family transcriptional regulator